MKHFSKRALSILLTLIMLISVVPLSAVTVNANGNITLAELQRKFPQDKYWNHVGSSNNNADGYTSTPCPSHSSTSTCNAYVSNGTKIGWQCFGFALKLGFDVYGSNPKNWGRAYDLNNIKAGDIINYDGSNPGHTVFVTKVVGNTVYFAECNYGGRCRIRWDRSLQKSQFNNLYNVYVAPYKWENGSTSHTHSYTITECEAVHPHKVYKKCSCGAYYYTGDTTTLSSCSMCKPAHTHSYSTYLYEPEHPHRISARCKDYATCGGWKWTDQYKSVKTCKQCWYFNTSPDKTSVTILTAASTEVTLNTSMFCPDSATMSINYDTSIIDATINSGVVKFTGKNAGTTNYKISVYSDSSKSYLIGSCTIKVTVKDATYTVKYDANGGTGAPAAQTKTYGKDIVLSSTKPTRAGYTFLGWSTSSSATSASYKSGYPFTANSNTTLYAVWEKNTVQLIRVQFEPNKTEYYIGDNLDTTGLQLRVVYSDGSAEYITSGFSLSGFNSNSAGVKGITVSYKGKNTEFTVRVIEPEIRINGSVLEVGESKELAVKTVKPESTSIKWTSSNINIATVSNGIVTAKSSGSVTITASFSLNGINYSSTATVDVIPKTIHSISVSQMPTKTTYEIGESLNTSGLKLKLTYSDGTTSTITSGFTTSGFNSTSAGTKTVTVSYDGKTTTFNVVVKAKPISDKPNLSISDKTIAPGSTFTIDIKMSNMPKVKSIMLDNFKYDSSKIELISAEWKLKNAVLSDWSIGEKIATLAFEENTEVNGVIMTLTFKAKENINGETNITCDVYTNKIETSGQETPINVSVGSGTVSICAYKRGDVNGDGYVNSNDAIYLLRYTLSSNRYPINQSGDMNGDKYVNSNDAIYLLRHTLSSTRYPLY